ncbi:MAG TPA: hypothetical protein VFV63_14180 [Ilumatobacteraceae bacterium]|nr:hypothetical protein [Ilumatobacteraceae bacterium]
MATVTTNQTTTTTRAITRPNLVISGRVTDAHGAPAVVGLQLTVAIEAVVADVTLSGGFGSDELGPTVYDAYGVELLTDADGRFTDSYDLADDVRQVLNGWVKCTVQLRPEVPDAPIHTKVVRWMRPHSHELIDGLSALLADVVMRS